MIEVTCKIKTYNDTTDAETVMVHSHWNEPDIVMLEVCGKRYEIVAKDIIEAVRNCINNNRF